MDISLETIAKAVQGEIQGDVQRKISGAASFESAAENEITFAAGSDYLSRINETGAGAVIVPMGIKNATPDLVIVKNPEVAFAKTLAALYPPDHPSPGIHPRAVIGENFSYKGEITVCANVVIGDNVSIGKNVILYPGVYLGRGVTLGDDVVIHPNVTIYRECIIGNRVVIQSGSVIGMDGFGHKPTGDGYIQTPHIGIVRIDDDVEIGAGNTIARGTLGETRIKKGARTDGLVHLGHNVVIGEHTLVIGQAGVAGSTVIGNNSILAGQVGIADHLTIGDNTIIGPKTGIAHSVGNNEIVSGSMPFMPHKLWLRTQSIIRQLPTLKKRIVALEKRVEGHQEKNRTNQEDGERK